MLAGEPVAVPTETVYGLAADATNAEAVARIYAAKGRPSFNPLIVHVPDLAAAEAHRRIRRAGASAGRGALAGPADAGRSASRRTRQSPASSPPACPTIALRVPAHPAMQALLKACGRPLAAPSANASGLISPTRASHVARLARRPDPAGHRRRSDRARHRIHHRRRDRRARCGCCGAARSTSRRRKRIATGSKRRASSPATTRRASPSASMRPRHRKANF